MEIEDLLLHHEGYRKSAYQDHLGYWTIGIGRLIDERRHGGISVEEAKYLLANDVAEKTRELDAKLPQWQRLSQVRRMAILNMAFQLGVEGLSKFKRMWAALEAGQFETAGTEALDSRWAQQTPRRAKEVVAMLVAEELPEIGR